MTLKILYHIPHPSGTGADRWIYNGWRDAFIDLGHEFHELTASDDLLEKSDQLNPDIFLTWINLLNFPQDAAKIKMMKKRGVKIFMGIWWPVQSKYNEAAQYLLKEDLADVYFGEREPEGMGDFQEKFGKKYFVIPNAANAKTHFPAKPVQKYQYDVVYLGAKLPMKKWFFDNVLFPLTKKYRVGIFGPYWTVKDNFYRFLVKSCKLLKWEMPVEFFNKLRIQIPADEENQLYSSAKICLNFHEREIDGSQPHYIINQRTFKIPACGGFQLCDDIPALKKYFAEDEIVTAAATNPQQWLNLIDYYLKNDDEREKIRNKAIIRALNNHTYHHRVQEIIKLHQEFNNQQ